MLHVTIDINQRTLVYVGIRRVFPVSPTSLSISDVTSKDVLCTYVLLDDENNELGKVIHRYGDGAEELVIKALHFLKGKR